MGTLIFICIIIVLFVLAYFFPTGVKVFGIDAEILFRKNEKKDDPWN